MQINNNDYGGFIVSKNILEGISVKYSFREESSIPQLNGWNLYSEKDDDEYVSDSSNFTILSANSIYKIAPVILEIFNAPYGTDLCWLYEKDVHIRFYDLIQDKEVSIDEIINNN